MILIICNVKHKEFKNEDIKVSPPTIKDFLCFGYINHSTAALFLWCTTQKLGVSEARENMYYYISYSHVTTFKQIKIIQKNKQGRQSTFCHI
jgi:hypothetical protein